MKLLAFAVAFALSACAPPPAPMKAAETSQQSLDDYLLKAGDRVRVKSRAGTFKPLDTNHTAEVNINEGRTGTLVQDAPGEIARVRWDAQSWDEFPPNGVSVALKEFEGTIHVSYLQELH